MKKAKKGAGAIAKGRSTKLWPDVCVRYQDDFGRQVLADAHFQLRNGVYLYLVWREKGTVKHQYLGKPSKRCTTPAVPAARAAADRGSRRRRGPGRRL